jgi:Na+-translocating ferredoxin:NAD+ oxidoreductase RnfG subunit
LLLTAKQSGAPVARFIKHLALAGPLAFIVPLLILVVLRIGYVLKSQRQLGPSSFDSTFLVFSAGWIGIGVVIVLMYLYQTRFGSLYLHIGIISSLFMVGLTCGALLISALLAPNRKLHPETLLFLVVFGHAFLLASIAYWPGERWTHLAFAIAFVLCGLCTGCYFPLAARQLADSGFETGQSGSKLETADHLGASVGGVLTSLAVVPVLGTKVTLFLFVLLILANVPLAALRLHKPREFFSIATAGFSPRRLGYALFGIGLSVVVCSNLLAVAGARLSPSLPQYTAQALAGESQIEQDSAAIGDKSVKYFSVYQAPETDPNANSPPLETQELVGYIFSSQDLAPEVRGFGGRINLGVYVDTTGKLIDFHIIRSNETPAYLELLTQWQDEKVKGRRLFEPEPFANVDAVTGATVSSEAVLDALQSSAHRFATQILGRTLETGIAAEPRHAAYLPNITAIYFVAAFVLTLIVIYYGGFWSRLAVLALNLVAGGIILNAQYSTEQMSTLLSLHAPAIALSGAFLLTIGVLLLVVIFGNIYCGYICPFGASQELLGYVLPRRFRLPLSREKMQRARFVKYVILFVLIILFFTSRNRTTLVVDPLISMFSLRFALHNLRSAVLWVVVIAFVGSIFYTRFWCRYLCPAGAFLSLFNNAAVLRRFLPAKKFGRCEFGLTAKDNMDCIYCDKCRYEAKAVQEERALPHPEYSLIPLLSRYLVVGVVVVAILVSAVSVNRFLRVMPADIGYPAALVASGGQPRDVDIDLVRTMIRQGRLSDREAEFYEKVENEKTTTDATE